MKRLDCFDSVLLSVGLAAALCVPTGVLAQETEEASQPEEIIINAPVSLRNLRLEINRAQENMFNVFNEFNDDDWFDVHCDYVRRWQSKIREQVCRPVFLNTALEQEANMLLGQLGFAGVERGLPGVTQVDHYNGRFEEIMAAVFQEHPEFRQAIDEYNSLIEYLNDVRKERFGIGE